MRDILDTFMDKMAADPEAAFAQPEPRVPPEVYEACFSTPAGRAVLEDLIQRFVYGTRFEPGMGADFGFYREGAASVVFDIGARIERASQGEPDDE